ncbi:MAG: hypothetical protein IT376_03255 [Polyangiaceae bacterium]|nr:hypothetical protein [Polyangiaceae bacterium]
MTRAWRWPVGALVVGATLGLPVGCGTDEPMGARVAVDASGGGAADGAAGRGGAGGDAGVDAAPPKRTMIQRVPFGNVAASDNLLWDGDFEWHTAFAAQYGWANTASLVVQGSFDQVRVGPECRSGMKCGVMTANQRIAAIGVSPSSGPVVASVWVRPPAGARCLDLSTQLFACDYGDDPDVSLADADGAPDASGWCELVAVSPPRARASCLGLEALFAEGEALVDDAVVRAAPAGARPWVAPPRPGAREVAAVTAHRAALRQLLAPSAPRATPALEALRRWRRVDDRL